MSSQLRTLIAKELKELLRDPKILVGMVLMPVIILPLMGGAISVSQQAVERELATSSIAIWDRDHSSYSNSLVAFLRTMNQTVVPVSAATKEQAVSSLLGSGAAVLLEIPSGYGSNVSSSRRGEVFIYAVLKSLGLGEVGRGSLYEQIMGAYRYVLSIQMIEQLIQKANLTGVDPSMVYSPLGVSYASVIKGRIVEVAPQAAVGTMVSQGIMLPITLIMMLTFAMQIASTSIAVEKEEKTLETLMTLPVGRLTIMVGKLGGSILVAVAGAAAYMIGFGYYMGTAMGFAGTGATPSIQDIGFGLGPFGLVLLGVTMFVSLVSGLALALSISVFTDSVRSAQSLIGVIYIPVLIPAIILMFADPSMLPIAMQILIYALPYSHSILASRAIFMGDHTSALLSISYIGIFTIVVLYITAKIFSSERVMTSKIRYWKLPFRKK